MGRAEHRVDADIIENDVTILVSAEQSTTPVLASDRLEALRALLGTGHVMLILALFRRETERRLAELTTGGSAAGNLASCAHKLVVLASQLGFSELASFCADLRTKLLEEEGSALIPDLRHVVGRASAAAAGWGTANTNEVVVELFGPGFHGAVFSCEWRDALWDRYSTGAPRRQLRLCPSERTPAGSMTRRTA